ncbi:MAG: cation:proton antiporter [Sphingomonadaceae bacterium]
MGDLGIVIDLVIAVSAALVGGAVAHRLGQPVVVGYLLAGVAIGPNTPGPVGNVHNVQLMAELGVAFLMFALGAEFSPTDLVEMRGVATGGGLLQIVATVLLGLAISPLLDLSLVQGLFLGSVIALSSTMAALKILMGRGELESLHGRVILGILIVQDLSVVPMMVILPALAGPVDGLVPSLLVAALKTAAILLGAQYLGTRIAPRALARVAATGSRELFLLAVMTLALGTALATYSLGLSLAFGAFMAGLVVSESEYSHQALAEVIPLRDIFSSVFFVSVGMLIDPLFVASNVSGVLLIVAAVVVGKAVIATLVPLLFQYPGREALFTGLCLAQIGEFSFVLAHLGEQKGIIDSHLSGLILASALVSILLNPLLVHEGRNLHALLRRIPLIGRPFTDRFEGPVGVETQDLRDHVVICGGGRVGLEMVHAMKMRGEPHLVVELDTHVISQLRRQGVAYVWGDAANDRVLEEAGVHRARLMAVTLPDAASVELAVRHLRRMNPTAPIVARVHGSERVDAVLAAGANEVVCPEFEAGLEFVRHAMARFGVPEDEIGEVVKQHRVERRLW